MTKTKFKYPPCRINPDTDKPFTKHKWVIPLQKNGNLVVAKTHFDKEGNLCYHVICDRCKVVNPRSERY